MKVIPKAWFFFTLILSSLGYARPTPSGDSCGFYLDFEKETGCWIRKKRDSDYLVRYGYKFCSLFKNAADDWKDDRKQWTKLTTLCLQQSLLSEKDPIDCPLLEEHAFASHPGCYEKAGFCKLTKIQKTTVVMVATGIDILLRPVSSLKQGLKLWGDCLWEIYGEVTVIQQRATELAKTYGNRSELASVFWVSGVPDDKIEPYLRFATRKLLGADSGALKKGIDAYTAIYGKKQPSERSIREAIQLHCIQNGKIVDSPECKEAFYQTGSEEAFLAMRSIPQTIKPDVIQEILHFKAKLTAKPPSYK